MRPLYYILPLFLLFKSGFAQNEPKRLDHRYIPIVFTDQSRLRDTPSVSGKILLELNANTPITFNKSESRIKDTINNQVGYWIPSTYKNTNGFIWENTLADYKFILTHSNRVTLCKQSSDSIFFTVFSEDGIVYENGFKKIDQAYYQNVEYIGETHYSSNSELFTWRYVTKENNRINRKDTFSWNGKLITRFTKRLSKSNYKIEKTIHSTDSIFLISNHVNLRSGPSMDSSIVTILKQNTPLVYLNKKIRTKSNTERQYWYNVSTPNNSGYIHSSLIMFPKYVVQSLINPAIHYMQAEEKLVVFRNDSILYTFNNYIGYVDTFYSKNTMGLPGIEILATDYSAEYCGGFNGSRFFGWDGKTLFNCGGHGGVGDGPFSDESGLSFPSQRLDGLPYIKRYEESVESVDVLDDNDKRIHIEFVIYSFSETLEYNGDTLQTVKPISSYSPLNTLMKQHFNTDDQPTNTLKIDLNNDGVKDVLFMYHGLYLALSDSSGELQIKSENKNIYTYIQHINLQTYNDGIAINIIKKQNVHNNQDERILRRLEFVFDENLNDLVVRRTLEGQFEYSSESLDVQYFKTKKIKLSQIW